VYKRCMPAGKAIRRTRVQYAALPYRTDDRSGLEVLLVTTRTAGRWILPKGWPVAGKLPHATAAQEAHEEAGLIGRVKRQAIGSYSYAKRMKNGSEIDCEVHVFPMEVTGQARRWPEKGEREVQWFSSGDAVAAIDDPLLGSLIRDFDASGSSITVWRRHHRSRSR
jgi:8-oxo-dGTP pyrophosphatase MutT (NUDIX family)